MKITQYTQENVGIGGLNVSASPSAFGGNTAGLQAKAQGMASAARDLGITADTFQEIQTRKEASDYAAIMAEKQLELAQLEQTLKQSEFEEGADLGKIYAERYEEAMKSVADSIPRTQRDKFMADRAVLRTRFAQQGVVEQAGRAAQKIKNNWEKTLIAGTNSIAINPANYAGAYELMRQQVESMPGGAEVKEAALMDGTQKLKGAYAEAQISRNPSDFIRRAKAGEYSDMPDVGRYINAAQSRIESIEAQGEKQLKKNAERNYFETYAVISNPETRATVTSEQIVMMVRNDQLSPSDGRQLINLLNTDEAREDDLNAYAELMREENEGTLTPEKVIASHAAGRLKSATAKSLIAGVTANLSSNEAYKSGQFRIKAEFDKSQFGVTMGDAATKEAEALREFQRRAATLKEGESLDDIAGQIVNRLRETSNSDRAYSLNLVNFIKRSGVNRNDIKQLEKAQLDVAKAAKDGRIDVSQAERDLNAIERRLNELKATNK